MENKKSLLTKTTRKLNLQLGIGFGATKTARDKKIKLHTIETLRSVADQKKYLLSGASKTMESSHLHGAAFDCAPSRKGLVGDVLRVFNIYYEDKRSFRLIAELGTNLGLRSLGLIYDWDWGHFELPLVYQPEKDCYAYAFINTLCAKSYDWRTKPIKDLEIIAEKLQAETLRLKDGSLPERTCKAAKKLCLIKSYKKLNHRELGLRDWRKLGATYCGIRYKAAPKGMNRWDWQMQRVSEGKGICNHAFCVQSADFELNIWNSHFTLPEFQITNENLGEISYCYDLVV